MAIEENDEAVNRFHAMTGGEGGQAVDDDEEPPDDASGSADDNDDEFVVGGDIDEPEGRSAKKRHRKAILERNRSLEAEARELRERLARVEGMTSAMPNVAQVAEIARRAAASVDEDEDPVMREVSELSAAQRQLWQDYARKSAAGKMSAEEEEEFYKKAESLDIKRITAVARRMAPSGPDQAAIEQAQLRVNINAKFPDLMGDARKSEWLKARFSQLRAEGMEDSWETLEVAAGETRARFGSRGEISHVDERRRERYTGTQVGRAASDLGSKTYKMTQADKEMADVMFENVRDEKKRYQMWVNKVGSKMVDRHSGR